MNTRMVSILQHLLAADTPVKSEHLAKLIQVTSRTVRSDIRELDEFLAQAWSIDSACSFKGV
ncbi:HTH domain-containing protein [Paenibacillus sp. RC334]|uniref:HTH domain-containing protein n=1 Tax=Paenibacillus sp. RC334 TaxID=3045840 RepID=UPI0024BAF70B|nr:HTH domain-containing protein [Paenibacillus sp. RC334]